MSPEAQRAMHAAHDVMGGNRTGDVNGAQGSQWGSATQDASMTNEGMRLMMEALARQMENVAAMTQAIRDDRTHRGEGEGTGLAKIKVTLPEYEPDMKDGGMSKKAFRETSKQFICNLLAVHPQTGPIAFYICREIHRRTGMKIGGGALHSEIEQDDQEPMDGNREVDKRPRTLHEIEGDEQNDKIDKRLLGTRYQHVARVA